ncbi:MAG: MBL fold metallo-hydrolase, partial [Acidobacteria bacterium]|nr:MBL fold metallo-hydrolase [Acidobacteriota bacterium]
MKRGVHGVLVFAATVALTAAATGQKPHTEDQLMTDKGPLVIHPIEHATAILEWDGRTIYLDPVGGADPFASFGRADLILITDIHGDHLSVDTVRAVSNEKTKVVVPAAVASEFPEADRDRVTVLDNGGTLAWDGVEIEAIPM